MHRALTHDHTLYVECQFTSSSLFHHSRLSDLGVGRYERRAAGNRYSRSHHRGQPRDRSSVPVFDGLRQNVSGENEGNRRDRSRAEDEERAVYRPALRCALTDELQSLCIMVPLTWSFCPRRAATLSPRNDRARYICDADVAASADQGALFREAKDTLKGVALKMHWIRTIESFYLGRAKKRPNESAQRNGWALSFARYNRPRPP